MCVGKLLTRRNCCNNIHVKFAYIIVKSKKKIFIFIAFLEEFPLQLSIIKGNEEKKQKKVNQWINPWLERRNQQEQLLRAVP